MGREGAGDELGVFQSLPVRHLTRANTANLDQATANKSFHLSLSRSLSATPAVETKSPTSSDLKSIQSLLSSLAIAQSASQASLVASFESRNAALWASIESSILQAEKEEGEKQRMMEENRKRGEEAERKAKEMRDNEVKKAEAEKLKMEEGKKEMARKAEERRQLEEAERTKAAAGQAAAARAGVQIGDAVEGSPKAEWERWTAQMLVSLIISLPPSSPDLWSISTFSSTSNNPSSPSFLKIPPIAKLVSEPNDPSPPKLVNSPRRSPQPPPSSLNYTLFLIRFARQQGRNPPSSLTFGL